MGVPPSNNVVVAQSGPGVPVGDYSHKASGEDSLFAAKKLIIDECLYNEALLILVRLFKQKPNDPELWALMAITLRYSGNRELGQEFEKKFNSWFRQNQRNPRAIIAALFLRYKTLATAEAVALVEKTLADKNLFSRFTSLQKKWFFLLAAEVRDDYLLVDFQEAKKSLELGKDFVERSLAIHVSPHFAEEKRFLNYRAYYLHGRLLIQLAVLAKTSGDRREMIEKGLNSFRRAIQIYPTAYRPCGEWFDLRKEEPDLPDPPSSCYRF